MSEMWSGRSKDRTMPVDGARRKLFFFTMPYRVYTSELVERVAGTVFPELKHDRVRRVLTIYKDRHNREEVWIATLRLCEGSIRKLKRALKRAKGDSAEVCAAAQSPRLYARGLEFALDDENSAEIWDLMKTDARECFAWLFEETRTADRVYGRWHAEAELARESDIAVEVRWKMVGAELTSEERLRFRDLADDVNDSIVESRVGVMDPSAGCFMYGDGMYALPVFGGSDDRQVSRLFKAVTEACRRVGLPPGSQIQATLAGAVELLEKF